MYHLHKACSYDLEHAKNINSCTTGSSLFKSTRTREYTKVHVTDTESSPFDIEQLKSRGMKKTKSGYEKDEVLHTADTTTS